MRMDDLAWRKRLADSILGSGLKLAEISRRAGVGRNYVQQMTKYDKNSRTDYVIRVCQALNVSLSYIFAGVEISSGTEELVQRFQALPEKEQEAFLNYLRSREIGAEAP